MFLYRPLSILALIAYSPYALLRSLTGRRRLGDVRGRLGKGPYPNLAGGVWIHAVSVGEVGVARNLVGALARQAPDVPLGLSVTTAAGRSLAQRLSVDPTRVFTFPLDLAGPVEAALSAVRPGLVLLTETEIWPLFLSRAGDRGIPVALVNGRLSTRSFRRYRLARRFVAQTLGRISLFAMQSEEDAGRIRALGAPADRVHVTGNIKYDLPTPPPFADAARLKDLAAGNPIVVAASTGAGEETAVLEAWRPLAERSLLVLAPRRPERFEEVAALIERAGFQAVRRSRGSDPGSTTRSPDRPVARSPVYLLDSIGELASLYGEASLAFVGGSLVPTGGHNPIEAWAQGVPVATGPHMEHFREIARRGEDEGFLSPVPDSGGLEAWIASRLADREGTRDRGERARAFVGRNRGAAESTVGLVLPLLRRGGAHRAAR